MNILFRLPLALWGRITRSRYEGAAGFCCSRLEEASFFVSRIQQNFGYGVCLYLPPFLAQATVRCPVETKQNPSHKEVMARFCASEILQCHLYVRCLSKVGLILLLIVQVHFLLMVLQLPPQRKFRFVRVYPGTAVANTKTGVITI